MLTDMFKKKDEAEVNQQTQVVKFSVDAEKMESLVYIADSIKTFQKELVQNTYCQSC